MTAPFVGRKRELEQIAAVVRQSGRQRAPVAVLITGEPGRGKTRLLTEASAALQPLRAVRVVGFEPNQGVPLAAVGDLIRALSKVPQQGTQLERLVFGARDRIGRAPLQIFEAAHRTVSAHGPLAITVDDLQWVDEQSVGLIHYVLRAAEQARQPLAIVAVSRPSPAAAAFGATIESLLPDDRHV